MVQETEEDKAETTAAAVDWGVYDYILRCYLLILG